MGRDSRMIVNGLAFLMAALVSAVGLAALTLFLFWICGARTLSELSNKAELGLVALIFFPIWLLMSHLLTSVAFNYISKECYGELGNAPYTQRPEA